MTSEGYSEQADGYDVNMSDWSGLLKGLQQDDDDGNYYSNGGGDDVLQFKTEDS